MYLILKGVGKRLQMSGFRCSDGYRCINEGRLTAATRRCEQITRSQLRLVLVQNGATVPFPGKVVGFTYRSWVFSSTERFCLFTWNQFSQKRAESESGCRAASLGLSYVTIKLILATSLTLRSTEGHHAHFCSSLGVARR